MARPYQSKDGRALIAPSMSDITGNEDTGGWCLECGDITMNAEPDAARYMCPECQLPRVFGLMECVLMGLVRD